MTSIDILQLLFSNQKVMLSLATDSDMGLVFPCLSFSYVYEKLWLGKLLPIRSWSFKIHGDYFKWF